jgi:NADPH:quinone reductase-like Zn-dependent oxidoreductase
VIGVHLNLPKLPSLCFNFRVRQIFDDAVHIFQAGSAEKLPSEVWREYLSKRAETALGLHFIAVDTNVTAFGLRSVAIDTSTPSLHAQLLTNLAYRLKGAACTYSTVNIKHDTVVSQGNEVQPPSALKEEQSYTNSKSSAQSHLIQTMAIPLFQKAILQPDRLKTDLLMITNHPVPTPNFAANEHLIRVHTTAITNGELLWPKNFPPPEPYANSKTLVPCDDVAGTVVLAPSSSPFQPGAEVYARSNYLRTGCARQYTILTTEEMAERPQRLSWAESAAVPMSAETAWQALFVHAGFVAEAGTGAKGKRVFVTAASGGVGVWMVQFAKWAGAEVVGTCSGRNVGWVSELGADAVVDYTRSDVRSWAAEAGYRADVAIDCIGGKALEDAWWVVKEGGTVISIFQPPEQKRPGGAPSVESSLFFVMEPNGVQLRRVTALIEGGFGKPALDEVITFDRFQEAFEKVAGGRTRGKVVLDLLA